MSTVAWKDVPTRTVDVGGVELVHLVLDAIRPVVGRIVPFDPDPPKRW